MQLPIEHVDVNLHPTKAEVAILHEDAVIQGICTSVQHALKHHHKYASTGSIAVWHVQAVVQLKQDLQVAAVPCRVQAVQTHHTAGSPAGVLEATRVRTDRTAQTIASLVRGPVTPVGETAAAVYYCNVGRDIITAMKVVCILL